MESDVVFKELNEYLELCGYGYRDRAKLLGVSARQTRKYSSGLLTSRKRKPRFQYYPRDLIQGFTPQGRPIYKIDPKTVDVSVDGAEAKDGSIAERHHARETIIKNLKIFILKNRRNRQAVWLFKIWKDKAPKRRTETKIDYLNLIDLAEEKGVLRKGALIEFDRVRLDLFKELESRGYRIVKYPKRWRPFNSLAEGVFGQLARKWYVSYPLFPKSKWIELIEAHLTAIIQKDPSKLLALRAYMIPEKEEESIAITVTH